MEVRDASRKATWRRWILSQGLSNEVGGKQRSFVRGRGGGPQHRQSLGKSEEGRGALNLNYPEVGGVAGKCVGDLSRHF